MKTEQITEAEEERRINKAQERLIDRLDNVERERVLAYVRAQQELLYEKYGL